MIYKEASFRNFNKFMTPLYAAPNIIAKASMINYYQEDVFSLGVTFLQMMGLYSSEELAALNLNGHHAEQRVTPVDQLKLAQPPLMRQLVARMLAGDADKRPSFLELRELFRSSQLALNVNNLDFVEGLLKEKFNSRRTDARLLFDERTTFQTNEPLNNRMSY